MRVIEQKAKWIWTAENKRPGDFVVFRRRFRLERVPARALCHIAAETKYYLYVNGREAVMEGGLFRNSTRGNSYCDPVDIAPYLSEGENVVSALVWHYGNGGRNNAASGEAGFYFCCEAIGLFSGRSFLSLRHPAFYQTENDQPSGLYGGGNIGYDCGRDIGDCHAVHFDDSGFAPSAEYENRVWGDLIERPIPLHAFGGEIRCEHPREPATEWEASFPYALQFSPVLEVSAPKGTVIDIRSDRYAVRGGPGDHHSIYNSHRMELKCGDGLSRVSFINYLYGEKMILRAGKPVRFHQIAYRESGYNTRIVGGFRCGEPLVDKLVSKSARTLYVCMRDNFMDCPDRERGQWIGDVSVQVPQTFFALDERAALLVRKAIYDFIHLRRDTGELVGNVPGQNSSELPAQSLNAISEIGMISQYVRYTGDNDILRFALKPCVEYLKLWQMSSDGLVISRKGDWPWFDHLYNVDAGVLENAWYFSALRFAGRMAALCEDHEYDSFLDERVGSIGEHFQKRFWKDQYYASDRVVDDRANAMAVLSGLCPAEHYDRVRMVLESVCHSTPYMENYVLSALCEMGFFQSAKRRMLSRYYHLAQNENSTLWEDFNVLGTRNHAWSGAPLTVAFKYFMGIDTRDGFRTFSVNPRYELFDRMSCNFQIRGKDVALEAARGRLSVKNDSDAVLVTRAE